MHGSGQPDIGDAWGEGIALPIEGQAKEAQEEDNKGQRLRVGAGQAGRLAEGDAH
jgi:hypothetical protein